MLIKEGKSNLRYIFIVVVLVAIMGGGILVLLMQKEVPSQLPEITKPQVKPSEEVLPEEFPADETVNWQTYRNEEFGFEIKYPEEWYSYSYKLDIFIPEVQVAHQVELAPYPDILSGGGTFGVRVSLLSLNETLTAFKNILGDPADDESLFVSGNLSGTKLVYSNKNVVALGETEQHVQIFIYKDGKTYSIYGLIVNTSFPEGAKFDQILSTFKFID